MKKYVLCGAAALLAVTMTACGDGSSEVGSEIQIESMTTMEGEPTLSETESAIKDYELRYSNGEFSQEDYHALADLYKEQGLIRKQRDMLEQSYRLFDDGEAFEQLQNISVNLAEEDKLIQSEAALMMQDLQLEDYRDESVNLIIGDGWFRTMMPKLYEGKRTYFLQQNGVTVLTVEVGYDENGKEYSHVWYGEADGNVVFLDKQEGMVSMLVAEGGSASAYNGGFEAWTCDGTTGNVYHEQGTFQNNVLTGDYTMSMHVSPDSTGSDLYSLWSNRQGMDFVTFTGNFNDQGATTLEQPEEKALQTLLENSGSTDLYSNALVYAYDESKENCLFLGLLEGEEAVSYSVTAESLGWQQYPAVEVYQAQGGDNVDGEAVAAENTENTSANMPKVRIYDGEIQLYIGSAWVSAGTVEQYAQEDPFRVYENSRKAQDGNANGTEGGDSQIGDGNGNDNTDGSQNQTEGSRIITARRVLGKMTAVSVPKANTSTDANKGSNSNKGTSSNKGNKGNKGNNTTQQPTQEQPATPETPATPAAPATPATPAAPAAPATPAAPSTPSTPSQPETPVQPPQGEAGDVDIEWTPDIL